MKKEKEEEERRRMPNPVFFYFALCIRKIALYRDVIHSFDWKSAIEYGGEIRNCVPNARYSSICNLLRQ